jgi:hypothetical protein
MTASNNFDAWLRRNPPPDLQALVAHHGGYDKIPPEAWAEHDRALAEWQERRQRRWEESENLPRAEHVDPAALCVCGLPGVYMRPRKPDKHGRRGRSIWRCEQHRDQWPDYADGGRNHHDYDATDDFSRSIDDCYAAIRARVTAGGKGWP